MASSDQVVLDEILRQDKNCWERELSDCEHFELFSMNQALKDQDLTYDDLYDGQVDGGDDGGIDGFFVLLNGVVLNEVPDDSEIEKVKRYPKIEVFLLQAKTSDSFSETAVDKARITCGLLFDLSNEKERLLEYLNAGVVEKWLLFRSAYLKLANKHPNLVVNFYYVSKGDTSKAHTKVQGKLSSLVSNVESLLTGAAASAELLGAKELVKLYRTEKTYTLQLTYIENYITRGQNDYVVLATLGEYSKFVSDERGDLRRYIFDGNVRDFLGDVEVNKDIKGSLAKPDKDVDFWWLNNGITILASRASIAGKTLTLDDVQIVNGVQTTSTIYNHFSEGDGQDGNEEKCILVRIIVTDNPTHRDRIIKATNFQSSIHPASLRATDKIQRDIETYFTANGLYYDRRKNYYKNCGKPTSKIITIPYLAQAIMSILLKEPDNARARPTSLLKRDSEYKRVFDGDFELAAFLKCTQILRRVESILRIKLGSRHTITQNFRFHLTLSFVIRFLGKKDYTADEVARVDLNSITEEDVLKGVPSLSNLASNFGSAKAMALDVVSKNREFVTKYLDSINLERK